MKKCEDSVELVISLVPTDRMGLTQKEMKARQEKEVSSKKTSLKNDDPSRYNKARDGAMSTMMRMTQLPP